MTITIKEIRVVTTVSRIQRDNAHTDSDRDLKRVKQEILEDLKLRERIIHKKRYDR